LLKGVGCLGNARIVDVYVGVRVLVTVEGGRDNGMVVENLNETHHVGIQGTDARRAGTVAIQTVDGAVKVDKGVGQATPLCGRKIVVYPIHLFGREQVCIPQDIHTDEMRITIVKRKSQIFS
jgi:hypothetical protein